MPDISSSAIAEIRKLEGAANKARRAYEKKCDAATSALRAFDEALAPLFAEAIEKFNGCSDYKIVAASSTRCYDFVIGTATACVQLHDSRGNEPDEEFEDDDVSALSERFAKIINPMLHEEGIGLVFTRLQFPSAYYGK